MSEIIPFNDLSRIHKVVKNSVIKNFSKIIEDNSFILNEQISEFESNFSEFTNAKYTITCANGTDAIELILRSLNIGFGDEVILPTNSFIATALAVTRSGATPIFVDNDNYYLINVQNIEKAITKKTKAIIAVNLYGQFADLDSLSQISNNYNLYLIEDSAQSHGAKNNKLDKQPSIASAYSFYPGKNLGAFGDGGAVTTNDKKIYERLKIMRNMGSEKKYIHKDFGYNSRPQPTLGIVLNEKLKHLHQWNEQRNKIANVYLKSLQSNDKLILPKVRDGNYHVWHLFVVQINNRNKIIKDFSKHKVEFGIHYPIPIHKQLAYRTHKQFGQSFSNADGFSKKLLSLPIFPKMKLKEVEKVIEVVNTYT